MTHEVAWTREETRPRICRKKDSEDGTTWEKKSKSEEETNGLCKPRHESHRDNKKMKSMTGLVGGESCMS